MKKQEIEIREQRIAAPGVVSCVPRTFCVIDSAVAGRLDRMGVLPVNPKMRLTQVSGWKQKFA